MQYITSQDQIDAIVEGSRVHVQVIFKESTRCPISRQVSAGLKDLAGTYPFWHTLVIQEHPELRSIIAERFGIPHESPQVLIIRDGQVVHSANHYDIDPQTVENYLDTA